VVYTLRMILYTDDAMAEVDTARSEGRLISDDAAQTIASWWYSPRATALVAFVTAGKVTPELVDEIDVELRGLSLTPQDSSDLGALREWARAQVTV
jgi:hypothetical protein